jgi:hypothetical protein
MRLTGVGKSASTRLALPPAPETREGKLILITGATGKLGRAFVARLLADPRFDGRAVCTRPGFTSVDGADVRLL